MLKKTSNSRLASFDEDDSAGENFLAIAYDTHQTAHYAHLNTEFEENIIIASLNIL
jgi:hypothetical protein